MPSHDGLLKGNNFIETHVRVEEGLNVAEDGDGTVGSSSRQRPSVIDGGSRSNRWKWTTPRYLPVGATKGALVTNTWAAIDTSHSGSRTSANAEATVAWGPKMMTSGVISEPAVPSS